MAATPLAGTRASARKTRTPRRRRLLLALRILSVPATFALVVAGIWVTGGAITNDFALAMWLTVAWMTLAGLIALAIAFRSREFRWPVLGAYAVTAGAAAVFLGASTLMDRTVNEKVATAAPATGAGKEGGGKAAASENVLLRSGSFEPVRHDGRGEANVIELAKGGRVLTLRKFEVENGPDLRVYLVAGPARTEDEVDEFVDLGGLKGNRGNQQYEIPPDVRLARYSTIVVWCRAFSALFARAPLRT
ncbi:MAG: DM13 domain-containing protein [Actinomycetota bacterium]|nr:DM13 domain-containing protein [Actinomycetota bacterium]